MCNYVKIIFKKVLTLRGIKVKQNSLRNVFEKNTILDPDRGKKKFPGLTPQLRHNDCVIYNDAEAGLQKQYGIVTKVSIHKNGDVYVFMSGNCWKGKKQYCNSRSTKT